MDEFNSQQEERKQSITSITRLNILKKLLEVEANSLNRPLFESRLVLENTEKLLSKRDFAKPEALIVGPEYEATARSLVTSIEEALLSITGFHGQEWRRNQVRNYVRRNGHFDEYGWSIGTVVYHLENRPVLRGNIELCNTEPIGGNISERLVQYLIAIPGIRDQLMRERHGHWGYHYHYIDDSKRRSDTLLTFDHRTSSIPSPALWWERHAEHHNFKARANLWGVEKRESVYSACIPDTLRFGLQDFKCPKANAEVVWP